MYGLDKDKKQKTKSQNDKYNLPLYKPDYKKNSKPKFEVKDYADGTSRLERKTQELKNKLKLNPRVEQYSNSKKTSDDESQLTSKDVRMMNRYSRKNNRLKNQNNTITEPDEEKESDYEMDKQSAFLSKTKNVAGDHWNLGKQFNVNNSNEISTSDLTASNKPINQNTVPQYDNKKSNSIYRKFKDMSLNEQKEYRKGIASGKDFTIGGLKYKGIKPKENVKTNTDSNKKIIFNSDMNKNNFVKILNKNSQDTKSQIDYPKDMSKNNNFSKTKEIIKKYPTGRTQGR